jgi:hypothetical protein
MDLYGWVTEEMADRTVAEWRAFTAGWQLALQAGGEPMAESR